MLDIGIVGAGPSGIIMADALTEAPVDTRVVLIESSDKVGGMPIRAPEIPPNSALNRMLAFVIESYADERLEGTHKDTIEQLMRQRRGEMTFGDLGVAATTILEHHLSTGSNVELYTDTSVESVQVDDNGYTVHTDSWDYTFDMLFMAQGARPKRFPFIGDVERVPFFDAMQKNTSCGFAGRKVVIAGAAHSAALAVCNAIEHGAEQIEVIYRGQLFRQHYFDWAHNVYGFSGIREPTYSRLSDNITRNLHLITDTRYPHGNYSGWLAVDAIGLEPNPIKYVDSSGDELFYQGVAQSREVCDVFPRIILNGQEQENMFGLGVGHPQRYTRGFVPGVIEKEGAALVGAYYTYLMAAQMAETLAGVTYESSKTRYIDLRIFW